MTKRDALPDPNETPEDVATLYSWANLHGAKYRDFSASRAQTREKARQRVEQAMEEERLKARQGAEAVRVLRARPVTLDTTARPPHPAARVSLAANNRRPRSSRFEPSACQRCRIARQSIMQSLVARSPAPRNRPQPSQKVASPFTADPDSLILVVVLSVRFGTDSAMTPSYGRWCSRRQETRSGTAF